MPFIALRVHTDLLNATPRLKSIERRNVDNYKLIIIITKDFYGI